MCKTINTVSVDRLFSFTDGKVISYHTPVYSGRLHGLQLQSGDS